MLVFCIASAAFAITHAANCSSAKHSHVIASTEKKQETIVQNGMKCVQMYARYQYEDACFDAKGNFLKLQYTMSGWKKIGGVVCPK